MAADDLKKRFDRIDICINNAGVAALGGDHTTKQGHEICMGVNHVGHFLFNARILPLLLASKAVTKRPAVRAVPPATRSQLYVCVAEYPFSQQSEGETFTFQGKSTVLKHIRMVHFVCVVAISNGWLSVHFVWLVAAHAGSWARDAPCGPSQLQGYLTHKKQPPLKGHHRAL